MTGMSLLDASKNFDIDLQSLKMMQYDGLLGKEIGQSEVNFLSFLQGVWNKPKYLRRQLSNFKPSERKKMCEDKNLTKVEKYLLGRFKNKKGRLTAITLMKELVEKFGIPPGPGSRNKIEKMRAYARNEMRVRQYNSRSEDD